MKLLVYKVSKIDCTIKNQNKKATRASGKKPWSVYQVFEII